MIPAGNWSRCFSKAEYPRRLNKFLLTASLAIFFGAIKDITLSPPQIMNLKVKPEELTNLPFLKISSICFLLALFFLGNILNSEFGSPFSASPDKCFLASFGSRTD